MLQHPPAETGRNIFSLHLWRNDLSRWSLDQLEFCLPSLTLGSFRDIVRWTIS